MQKSNIETSGISSGNHSHKKRGASNDVPPSSKYKGVCWIQRRNQWSAQISKDKKKYSKYFAPDQEIEAALWYDEKARELYGEFAQVNIVRKAKK